MNEERMKVLSMIAEGKISPEEGEKLLDARETETRSTLPPPPDPAAREPGKLPEFFYVQVRSEDGDNVDIRIPMALVKAGIKLSSLMPKEAREQVDSAMEDKGIAFNLDDINPENMEELLQAISDLQVDVNGGKDTIRVYCA